MKLPFATLLLSLATCGPALAGNQTGFSDSRFAALVGFNLVISLALLFCLLVLAVVGYEKLRHRRPARIALRPRPNRRRPTLR